MPKWEMSVKQIATLILAVTLAALVAGVSGTWAGWAGRQIQVNELTRRLATIPASGLEIDKRVPRLADLLKALPANTAADVALFADVHERVIGEYPDGRVTPSAWIQVGQIVLFEFDISASQYAANCGLTAYAYEFHSLERFDYLGSYTELCR